MKNVYRLEYWSFQNCKETKEFTNKKEAQKWLKESDWWIDYIDGYCSIAIYKNGKQLDWDTKYKEWLKKCYQFI